MGMFSALREGANFLFFWTLRRTNGEDIKDVPWMVCIINDNMIFLDSYFWFLQRLIMERIGKAKFSFEMMKRHF